MDPGSDKDGSADDWRLKRREQRRQELARRRARTRLAAGGLLAAVALAVLGILITSAGSSPREAQTGENGSAQRGSQGSHGANGSGTGAGSPRRSESSDRSGAGKAGGNGGANRSGRAGGDRSGSGDEEATAADLPRPPRDVSAPILMYHVINPPPEGAPFPGLYVPKQEFAQQMQALARAGFHAVTLQQLWEHWKKGTPLPPGKPVVLSFDNGYQSQYSNALPILEGHGWKGVENIQLSGLPPSQGGLSKAQVRGLIAAGWELDTQGFSHAELIALSPEELHFQVVTTRKRVQDLYHVPVRWFCYPSGHYNATVIEAVKEAGYLGSTTVVPGWASPTSNPYQLPRIRVLGGTSGPALVELIEATEHNPPPPAVYE